VAGAEKTKWWDKFGDVNPFSVSLLAIAKVSAETRPCARLKVTPGGRGGRGGVRTGLAKDAQCVMDWGGCIHGAGGVQTACAVRGTLLATFLALRCRSGKPGEGAGRLGQGATAGAGAGPDGAGPCAGPEAPAVGATAGSSAAEGPASLASWPCAANVFMRPGYMLGYALLQGLALALADPDSPGGSQGACSICLLAYRVC
jgi:hypothetical protein